MMSMRLVIASTDVAWDGVIQHFPAGTLVEVEPGSALEAAYGPSNLEDLDADAAAAMADHAGVSN
jgi:hypothetical protein